MTLNEGMRIELKDLHTEILLEERFRDQALQTLFKRVMEAEKHLIVPPIPARDLGKPFILRTSLV